MRLQGLIVALITTGNVFAQTFPSKELIELFHVIQYREWGVDDFALRYIENRAEIENDAWSYLWQWIEERG